MRNVLAGILVSSPIFDMRVTLEGVSGGHAAMDRREALKVPVRV